MNVIDSAIDSAKEHAKELAAKILHSSDPQKHSQAITIGRPRAVVAEFFQDPAALSQVLGDIADVESIGSHRLRWTFAGQDHDTARWECVVSEENATGENHVVRFGDVRPESTYEITLHLRDAPAERGTEVIARVSDPAPGLLAGPLIFKALYRARALLQTGEVPTISHNPSARRSDR